MASNAKGQATLPKEEEFMDKYEIWLLNNRLNNKVIGSKEKTGHYYVSDAIRDYESEKFGNVAKPDACAQLCEGWRDVRKELPPADFGVYFVYDKEGSMGCAHYLGEGIFGGWPDVIAWMPLLSPPAFV